MTVDLKLYYHKMRTIEATIPGESVVVVSLETQDGGREGQVSEVARAVAARLVVEGKARLASDQEARAFKDSIRTARRAAEEQALKERLPLGIDAALLRSVLREDE